MDKKEALSIIFSAAEKYNQDLLNKNLLFVYKTEEKLYTLETVFLRRNFLHLTGLAINEKIIKSSNDFYNVCLNKRLRAEEFDFYSDGTTVKKLEVLNRLMQIQSCAQMTGYYSGTYLHLKTDRIVGNVSACLGFMFDTEAGYYIPNTAIKVDCRDIIKGKPLKILAILKKSNSSSHYSEVCKICPEITIETLNTLDRVNIK